MAITRVSDALRRSLGPGWPVRIQAPIALDAESGPGPDVAVVPGGPRDDLAAHPRRPALVVEAADSGLAVDRGARASLYARAPVADCWLVNLVEEVVEAHRPPRPDPAAPHGWHYGSIACTRRGALLAPVAAPACAAPLAGRLP